MIDNTHHKLAFTFRSRQRQTDILSDVQALLKKNSMLEAAIDANDRCQQVSTAGQKPADIYYTVYHQLSQAAAEVKAS